VSKNLADRDEFDQSLKKQETKITPPVSRRRNRGTNVYGVENSSTRSLKNGVAKESGELFVHSPPPHDKRKKRQKNTRRDRQVVPQ
jgi:hypothetical protein